MELSVLDISDNHFTSRISSWLGNMCGDYSSCELVMRNQRGFVLVVLHALLNREVMGLTHSQDIFGALGVRAYA